MQAIILAAGKGTRLGKLTEEIPKAMIPIAGKPFLFYILENLPVGIDSIIIAIGHNGEKIRDYFGDSFKGKLISYLPVPELNGTADTLFKAKLLLKSRFLVLFGDDFY